jgi:hypothetical protein
MPYPFGLRMALSDSLHFRLVGAIVLVLVANSATMAQSFKWNWRQSRELSADRALRNSNLTSREKKSLAVIIADALRPEMAEDPEIQSEAELQEAALNTRILVTDLNRDRHPEVVAQGMAGCGATGNCPFWVFQKVDDTYKLLLDGYGQTFTLQPNYTMGFPDIVIGTRDSASEVGLTLYRYDHGNYHDVSCYDATWTAEDNPSRRLAEPHIIPCRNQSN